MDRSLFSVQDFLDEPRLPASVATTTGRGNPALAMMWFVAEEGRLWFHTPTSGDRPTPFLDAARRHFPGWSPDWADHAASPDAVLWSMSPDRGMAVTYPGLANGPVFRWSNAAEGPFGS